MDSDSKRKEHEWVNVFGIEICHWCGVAKSTYDGTICKSNIKIVTKDGKMEVVKRDDETC